MFVCISYSDYLSTSIPTFGHDNIINYLQRYNKWDCDVFLSLLERLKELRYCGPIGLAVFESQADLDNSAEPIAIMLFAPCDLVTQWGTRHECRFLQVFFRKEIGNYAEVFSQIEAFAREQTQAIAIFVLDEPFCTYSTPLKNYLHSISQEAWEYAVTSSIMFEEKALRLIPLNLIVLQENGGEIDLPMALEKQFYSA